MKNKAEFKPEYKPLVSILLAVYKANEKWLVEQLQSLNQQDYSNLELIIWDDCPESPVDELLFQECVTNYQYQLIRGESNLGSNGAFEELTKRANGEYLCYCDQDDVWNANKISVMLEKIIETRAALVCCDQYIIDGDGNKIGDTITDIRKRHTWRSGTGLAKYLISDNFVTGCALIMKTDVAKRAVPFEPTLVHDQWLGIVAALHGSIEVIMEPLIGYRQHGTNQTGILLGVEDKKTYYEWRIEYFLQRAYKIRLRLLGMSTEEAKINRAEMNQVEMNQVEMNRAELEEARLAAKEYEGWMEARKGYFRNPNLRDWKIIKSGMKFSKSSAILDMILPIIPEFIFKYLIRLAKKGVL